MSADATGLQVLDLGAAWNEMTGLPFVWAVWMGPSGRLRRELAETLVNAKEQGVQRVQEIALIESKRLGWPERVCLRYLAEIIDFDLSERHWQGFALFSELCAKHGFISSRRLPCRVDEATVL
jgi:chorismate dehydratase